MDMLRSVPPHIFSGRRLQLRYMKGALVSFWKQGVRRLDRAYFRLLWQAGRLDRKVRRRARDEARHLRRLLRRLRRDGPVRVQEDLVRLEEWVGQAHDYLVRFRPDARLEQVREWAAAVRTRASLNSLSVDDARDVYENARRYLKVQMKQHRFPGVALSRAMEAAIKGLHYERVMNEVVGGAGRS
jgi:hypothetical protein